MNFLSHLKVFVLGSTLAVVTAGVAPAFALPKERDVAANARVEDADGRAFDLATLKGKPYVIIYDDRDSHPKSETFKTDIIKRAKAAAGSSTVTILPVADLRGLDYWPAKGIVQGAMRKGDQTIRHHGISRLDGCDPNSV